METFLSDLRKKREELKGQPKEMAKVINSVFVLLWLPYVIGQAIIFLPCGFFLLSFFFFFSSHNLSGRRLDVYHTSTHGVALVRI